jgi:amino acid adenylation domain-containing protein/non-ribosomal peptide synthase protein (TIGR01720 family)
VVLERLPLTVNGKLDKAALPAPVFDRAEYTAPATEAERQLASIWQDVLRIERVGIHDNFFEIGGDSILSIQVVARASQAGLAITARQLFETQTIAGLAARAHAGARREAPQEAVGGATALLPIQVQFLNEPSPDHDHYNQAVLLEIPASFRQEWLGALVGAVYRRHDALRLRFAQVDGAWQGEHQPLDDVMIAASCAVESLPDGASEREAFITSRCNHWQGSFDLGKGPLLRAVLFQGNDAARLLLVAHHIVIDGVSWRILLADLERAYRQLENGEPVVLPPKTSSFQQWAAAMAASVDGDTLAGERGYWLERARLPVPPLPVDFEAADCGEVASTAYAGISLPASETELLLQQCNRAYRTQINELLLAAVYLGLRRWTGELGLRIALEGHGREDIFEELDVTQTLGWFTTVYPLTLWSEASLVGDIIKSVKEQYRAVPRRGCGYGVLRHLARDAALIEVEGGQPPSLAFNYLGQSEQAVSEGSVFRGAPESAGAAIGPRRLRRHPLVLKGLVAGGELRLSLEYSTARHAPETVQRALRCIEESLREVIDHCAQCDTAAFTPSDFPLARVSQAQLDAWQAQYPSLSKLYPATPTQAGLFFHGALDRSAYVTQTIPVFRGTLDVAAFKAAWQAVVQRHDVFRTAFVGEDEQLHQLVSGTATLDWHEEDWRGLDPQAQERRLDSYRRADRERGFDFARAPLMRMALLRLADDRHQLLWTHHHILSDGWSMPIVYREVMEFYQARLAGRAPELQGAPAFEGYVGWLAAQDQAAARAYWRSQLGSIEAPTPLAIDKLPVADRSAGYREQSLTLSAAEGDALQVLATSRHVTMNTIVQLAWAYVLHCYSGERDVVFGATISGRPPEVPGIEAMVGLFINTIPVKLSIDPEATVADLLADLQREFQCANEFGYLALTDIQRQSQVPAGTQLFESLLVMGNYPIEAAMEAESRSSGLGVESKARHERTGYKLAFNIGLRGRVHLQCGYPGGEFEEETVARLLAHFAHVLRQLPQALDRPIHTIDLLDATEHACIARWNDVPAGYPTDRCVHQLFEDHAARAPEAIAARFDGQALTYAELNREANRVAHYLIDQGVAPDTLVGLCIERSLDMLVGMLGILKAGAAYVPLDPEYPEERLAYMLEDSGVEIVLTHSELLHSLGALGERTVMPLDGGLRDSFFGGHSDANPGCAERGVNPTSLAYAMYTSGSTGQPKGALIEHRNIVRLVHAPNYARFPAGGVMAQVSNSAFDAATFELWGALANGMTLHHIGKETLLDPPSLARAVADAGVTTMLVTTAVFNQVASICPAGFASVDYLLFGGEGVDVEAVNRVLAAGKPRHLVHAYGPTENTSLSTTFEIDGRRTDTYPIGTPISGTTQYVLDARRRPVPCGVVGELYLGGDGVGRGYLGRPELTAERFVPDPFSTRPGARLYRSGDLVRRLPDGNVQFVGRVDDQVKIRGFRIELGEIETQLLGHEAVSEAVILARRDGPLTRLVAYVACRGDGACDNEFSLAAEWRSYLKLRLPDYMIPSAFVVMEALPLNPNGKVDKRRLPEPDYHALQTYAAPQTETERKLADIWKQLLRLEQVGIHDNFFESGGDSILSIQMVARAGQAGIAITTKQLFEAQTIAELARLANAQPEVAAPQDEVTGPLALLPIHRYFLEGEAHDRHHYNQAVLLEAPPEFDEAVLRAIASAVYRRHDALRLRFVETPDGWQAHHQAFTDELLQGSCIVERLPRDPQAHAAFIADRCAYWQRGFDLAAGPLLRAVHFRPPAGQPHASGRLLLAVHHIVVDGVSWRVLLSDLERAYDQALRGEEVRLDAKTSSFQQWGDALATYARSEELREERPFWLAQLGEEVRPLPVDHAIDGLGAIATGKTLPITFSVEDTRALQQHCHTAYRTQISELLLAGVYLGMRAWTGESALRIRLEGHGRESLFDQLDVSQTVGWFTSIFPLTLHSAAGDVGAVIKAVKEQFRAIPRRGIGYGVLRYLAGDAEFAERAVDREGALLFNYLGQFDQVINETTRFQPASEPTGPQVSLERQRATQLGVSGKIFGGQLQLGLNYSRAQYESGTMERLAGLIEDALRAVIAHCQQPGVGSFTPSDFPLARVDQAQLDAWQQRYPALVNVYPATPMQAGLVFHSLLDSAAYVIQSFPVLRGELDLPAFRKAWQQTVDRHDIFRTAFVGEGEAVHQVVSATAVLPWHEEDLRGLPREEQVARYESYRVQDKQAGFDFERAPLMRVAVFRLDDDRYQLLWTQHHVVLDGWCLPLVYRDVIELYRAQTEDRPPALGSPPSFEAYIAWLQTRKEGEAHAHWRALLEDFDAPTPLMSDRTGKGPEQGQREQHLELTAERTDALQALAQAQQTTVNTLLQWCWGYLLHRYSGEGEVVFGATISGRPADIPGIEEMVGMFINTIPVRASFDGTADVRASLARLHRSFHCSNEHGYLSLPEIQRQSRVRAGTPLFDSLVVFENYPLDAVSDGSGTSSSAKLVIDSSGSDEHTTYKLTIGASLRRTLKIKCGYQAEFFSEEVIGRLLGHLQRLLEQLPGIVAQGRPVDLIGEAEAQQLRAWGASGPRAIGADVVACLREWAAVTPDAPAVVFGELRLAYRDLDDRTERLARSLRDAGVSAESRVGLCLGRSAEQLIAVLGVLKAGGAYVPLDPGLPAERVAYMLDDAGVELVLLQSGDAGRVPLGGRDMLLMDQAATDPRWLDDYADGAALPGIAAGQLAYVLYTSGSTGRPKGVMVTHGGLANYLGHARDAYLPAASGGVVSSPLAFDATLTTLLAPLTAGKPVTLLPDDDVLSALAACMFGATQGALFKITPAHLDALALMHPADNAGQAPHCIVVGGEQLRTATLERWRALLPRATFVNEYGPTETVVGCSIFVVDGSLAEVGGAVVPIGRPIANTALQVLSRDGSLQPIGSVGELYIGGAGVARGYANRPDLAAERFVERPFEGGVERMYRTGDLVRWLPSGQLEFVGRCDDQVKVRGFRIELGEVEHVLASLPGVSATAAAVQPDADGENRLAGFVVPVEPIGDADERAAFATRVRDALAERLPAYMIPSAVMVMESLPLTANGKLDRRALPAAQAPAARAEVLAETPTERTVASIWQGLLNIEQVDIMTSFFELGGHSLLVVRLLSELRLHFGIEIAIRDVFDRTTVRALSAFIDECTLQAALKRELALDGAESDDQELIEL